MKQRLIFLLKNYLYWVSIFVFSKVLFVLYQHQISKNIPVITILKAIKKGLIMDISLSSYILMFTSLIITLCVLIKGKTYSRLLRFLNFVFLILAFLVVIGDLELYKNWGFHVDSTPLFYLKTPKDAFASVNIWLIVALLSSIGILVFIFDFIYKRYIQQYLNTVKRGRKSYFFILLFVTASMIIPIRGGLKLAPLNPGALYFHENIFVNHVAINPVWNLMYSLKKVDDLKREYSFMPKGENQSLVDSLYVESDTFKRVIKNERPNVVLILMESFSAKTIEVLGGKKGVTPNLNKFSEEGILFKHMYACGNRSDKGIPAVLSAYPCHPGNSILRYPSKSMKLPCLAKDFNKIGYSTSFYYGGDINFANIRQYVGTGGFKSIVADEDFDPKYNTSKWGVHDHIMLKRFYDDMLKETKPFFKMVFTLSSHEPFDVPMETVIKGNSVGKKYLNSVYYTDKCIGEFIERCKKSPIWDNTLFIMIADHGTRLPDGDLTSDPICFKIPMIWMGGVLKDNVEPVSTYCTQADLARTLLCQMNIDNKEYIYSKNLFADKKKSFSFYTYNDGVTFINDSICSIFDNTSKKYIGGNIRKETRGRALLQNFYNDFKNR